MYTLITTVKVKEELYDVFLEQICFNARNSITNESGCLRFDVTQDSSDRNTFFLYEIYDSEASFIAHGNTSHFESFKSKAPNCFAEDPKTVFLNTIYQSELKASNYVDASIMLHNDMVCWPNDPPFSIEKVMDVDTSRVCNLSKISMGLHSGTHMDAPLHFLGQAIDITHWPFHAGIGKVRVVAIDNPNEITDTELATLNLQPMERIIFKTKNSREYWGDKEFLKDCVHISVKAADFLAKSKIMTVGVDYLSVGNQDPEVHETHRILFRNSIWIIEGLNLVNIEPGEYNMISLPLKMRDAEASPTRVILEKL